MSVLALDRQAIEKRDFPLSRRGYDPAAVGEHLRVLAGEVEALQQRLEEALRTDEAPGAGSASLASAASDQVRLIVEAAESTAAEIERSARADAGRTREEAVARSREQVGGVTQAASAMLQRVDAMEGELGALLDSLRAGAQRLTADLSGLEGGLGDLYDAAGGAEPASPPRASAAAAEPSSPRSPPAAPPAAPEPRAAVSPGASAAGEPGPPGEPEPVPPPAPSRAAEGAERAPAPPAPPSSRAREPAGREPAPPAPATRAGDLDGARLVALNMALDGRSREETEEYLRAHFALADLGGLLDEVYATVEG